MRPSRSSSSSTAQRFVLDYEPGESTTPLFGGNSNWRGPVWFPLNFLLIEALQKHHYFLGDDFKVELPDRLRQRGDALGRDDRPHAPADQHFPAGRRRAGGRSTAIARNSATIRTGATSFRFTSTFTATTARARREPPDRLDRGRGEADPAIRRIRAAGPPAQPRRARRNHLQRTVVRDCPRAAGRIIAFRPPFGSLRPFGRP